MKVCNRCLAGKPVEQFHRHPNTKDGRQSYCKECNCAAARANYWANHEKRLVHMKEHRDPVDNARRAKEWREKNPERFRAATEAWRKKHWEALRPKYAAVQRALHKKHPERAAIYAATHRKKHREQINAASRAHGKTERGRLVSRAAAALRRARKRGTSIGPVDFARIYQRDGGRCWICWLTLPMPQVHFDHVMPLSRGGAHVEENIRVACRPCNDRKLNKLPTPELIARIHEEVLRMSAA